MKKLAYVLVFIFVSASLASCGAASQTCESTKKIKVKNSKFETQDVIVSTDLIYMDDSN